jgi:hypothetical protein
VKEFTDLRGEFGILQGDYAGVRGEFHLSPRALLAALRALFRAFPA